MPAHVLLAVPVPLDQLESSSTGTRGSRSSRRRGRRPPRRRRSRGRSPRPCAVVSIRASPCVASSAFGDGPRLRVGRAPSRRRRLQRLGSLRRQHHLRGFRRRRRTGRCFAPAQAPPRPVRAAHLVMPPVADARRTAEADGHHVLRRVVFERRRRHHQQQRRSPPRARRATAIHHVPQALPAHARARARIGADGVHGSTALPAAWRRCRPFRHRPAFSRSITSIRSCSVHAAVAAQEHFLRLGWFSSACRTRSSRTSTRIGSSPR